MSELENVSKTEENKIQVSETEILESIKAKFEGKTFGEKLERLILEARRVYMTFGEKVQTLIEEALNEGFSKEDSKTIVSMILGVSTRTVERYFPSALKEPKYVSKAALEAQQKAQQVAEQQTGEDQREVQEKTPEEIIKFYRKIMREVQKKHKTTHDMTISGHTFNISTESKIVIDEANEENPVSYTEELIYDEKAIIRTLKS